MTSLLICFNSISVMAYSDLLQKQIDEVMYDNGKTLKEVVNYTFDEEGNVIDVVKVEGSENIEKYVKAKILNEKESKNMETKMIKEATVTAENNNVSGNVSITNTVSINQGYSHEIPAGKYGSIRVYIDYNQDYFTVYREGLFGNVTEIGDGSYIHAVGASFFYYE